MGDLFKNQEGYADPTAGAAMKEVIKEARKWRPLVYICSPYSGDPPGNTKKAIMYSRFAVDQGAIPLAPHLLLEKSSFSNIEQQSLEFVKYTLDPWVARWEQAISRTLFSQTEKATYFVKFNVDGLLRGDYQSRMNGYATARQNGWMSANDIRELENLDRIPSEEGGDLYLINGNMLPLKNAGAFADTTSDDGKEETSDEEQEVLGVEKSGRRNRTGGKSPGA